MTTSQVKFNYLVIRQLTKDKYFFTESVQTVFPFPTYFVSKYDDNYSDDHNLSVHTNLSSGGHFKSPSCSPTHTSKANSNVGTPSAETPIVSPYVSPRGSPSRKHSIYDIFCVTKVYNNPHINIDKVGIEEDVNQINDLAVRGIPEVRIQQSTPVNSQDTDSIDERDRRSPSRPVSRNGRHCSPKMFLTHKKQKAQSFGGDSQNNENDTKEANSELIVTDNSVISGQSPTKKKKRKPCLLFFCFGWKRKTSNMIKVKPKPDSSLHNVSDKKCIKDNLNNSTDSIEDNTISGRQLSSCADRVIGNASDTGSRHPSQDSSSVNYKERRRKTNICCF